MSSRHPGRPLWAVVAAAIAACSSPDPITGPGADRVASVSVSPDRDTLVAIDASLQLTAEARDAEGQAIAGRTYQWTSSDPAVATVSTTGRVTAVGPGEATISAQSGQAIGTARVVVAQQVTDVTLTPAIWAAGALDAEQQLTAAPHDANGHPVAGKVIQWASSDSAVATISPAGVVTAMANGAASITATVDGENAATAVTVAQVVATLSVTPEQWSPAALGEQHQLMATALDANGHEVADWVLSWETADSTIAVVSKDGMATATGVGSTTINADAVTTSSSVAVMVAQAVDSVVVVPATDTLRTLGDTLRLQAGALDANQQQVNGATFTWQSSNPAAVTVDNDGLATAVAEGTATITATADGKSAQATLVVAVSAAPALAEIFVAPDVWTATAAGAKQQFQVYAKDANGNDVNVSTIAWSSSDPAVASTDGAGLVTAKTNGQVILTATAGGLTSTASITVDVSGAIAEGVVWSMYFARQIESPALLYTNGLLRTPLSDGAPYPAGNVKKFQWEGDRIGVLTDVFANQGTLRIRDRVGEWVDVALATVRDFQLEGNRIGALHGDGQLRVKDGTHAPWTTVATSVTAFRLEGNRIGARHADGSFRVKDGINGGWTVLASGGVADFHLEGNRIGVRMADGDFRVKDGIHGTWTLLANGNAADFRLEGNRIALLQQDGTFRVKDGVNGTWTVLANGGVDQFALDGNRIGVILPSGAFRVKDGIHGAWTTLGSNVVDFDLHKGRIGMVSADGTVRVKTGSPNAPWTFSNSYPPVAQFSAAVAAPMRPYYTTPESYATGQANCGANCARAPYIPVGLVLPVPVYGRNCGDNRPGPGLSQEAIDGMDQICYHHDRAPSWYANATGSLDNDLLGPCIVRYGIANAIMTRHGTKLQPGSAAYNQAWGLMPNTREARRRYINWTSSCTEGYMNQFEADTRLDL